MNAKTLMTTALFCARAALITVRGEGVWKMKKMAFVALAVLMPLLAAADTETVDGIEWTYTVTGGKARVGGGEYSSAIPQSTTGAVAIPSTLGGCPVTSIGAYAFGGCSGLTSVTIPSSVTSIGYRAFAFCWLESVTIPSSVTSIGREAFSECYGLKSVTIPSSVTGIGDSAFAFCSGLTSVTISEGVTSIGVCAFCDCRGLTLVTIPSSVTSIGGGAFYGCTGLMSFSVDASNPSYSSRNGLLCSKDGALLVAGVNGDVTIPSGVTSVGDCAFWGCSGLTSVTIPSSVTSIGVYAFAACDGLMSVTIPSGVTSIGGYAFSCCSGLTSVTIPSSVTSIGAYAFDGCSGLTSVTIPSSVTSIGVWAFAGRRGLESVAIPDGVTSIGPGSFEDCSGLKSVTIPSSVTNIGGSAFSGCRGLESVTIPSGVTSIGDYAFSDCSSLTSVTIPSSVTSIGVYAFEGGVFYVGKGDKDRISRLMLDSAYPGDFERYCRDAYPLMDYFDLAHMFGLCSEFVERFTFVEREVPTSRVSFYKFVKQAFSEKLVVEERTVATGVKLGDLPEVSAEGMTFDGWWTCDTTRSDKVDETYVERVSSDTVVTEDMTIVGRWTPNAYRIVLDDRGGDVMSPVISVAYGAVLEPLPTPTRSGCSFAGWKTADGKLFPQDVLEALDGCGYCYEIAGDTVLYADWLENGEAPDDPPAEPDETMVRVSFVAPNGTVAAESLLFPKGGSYGALPEARREGFTFAGWYASPLGEKRVGAFDPVDPTIVTLYARWAEESSSLYAQWEANAYAVSFDANGGTGAMPDQAFFYDQRQGLSLNVFTRVGYAFAGWATSAGGDVVYADGASVLNLTAEANGAVKLFAVWREEPEIPVDPVDPPFVPPVLVDESETVIAADNDETAPYEKAAAVYDGYLYDADGNVAGTVQVKVAKGKVDKKIGAFAAKATATVQLADGSKKLSFKGGVADEYGNVSEMADKNGNVLAASLGVKGIGGEFRRSGGVSYRIDGARNIFSAKDKETKESVKAIENAWVGAVNVVGGDVALAVSIAKKGKVKVSGTVGGAKVSATSQLLVGDGGVCCVPVVITKKANLAFNLWLNADGSVEIAGLDGAAAGKAGTLKSGAAFRMNGAALEAALPGLLAGYLPDGVEVAANGKKWVVAPDEKGKAAKAGKIKLVDGDPVDVQDSANPSGLKLTYTAKSGMFKGSFKAYTFVNGKIKSYTVNVTGVMLGDRALGTATLKKPAVSFPIAIE